MTFKVWIADTGEKVLSTLIQTAIVYVLAAQAVDEQFYRGLLVACVIAASNVLKAALFFWIPNPENWMADMVVRAVWTFLIALLGSVAAIQGMELFDTNFWVQVLAAAGSAALVVVKSTLAKRKGDTLSPASLASTLPKAA